MHIDELTTLACSLLLGQMYWGILMCMFSRAETLLQEWILSDLLAIKFIDHSFSETRNVTQLKTNSEAAGHVCGQIFCNLLW